MAAVESNRVPQANSRKIPLAVLFLVLGIYILTMSGHTYSPDEETMLETSRALITKGTWAMSPSHALVQVPGMDGRMYSQYGPGQSLAAVPWVAAGLLVGDLFPKDQAGFPLRLILGSYNALIMAGLAALFAAMSLALGYSPRASFFSALVLAFATFLWPHSRTFFAEPLVALALFASFYLLYIGSARDISLKVPQWLPLLASGVLFALAVATKVQYSVALPAFLVYLGWRTVQGRRSPATPALWLAGLLAGLIPLFLYNTLVFGSPLDTGYGSNPASTLTTPILQGALGLLLSPGKGLLWYAFPIVLAFAGLVPFARKHRAEAAFIVLLFLSVLALFSVYSFWPGDGSWGPRYLSPALAFLLLPMLPVIERAIPAAQVVARSRGSIVRLAVSVVIALGFLSNLLGVLVNFDTYINVVNDNNTRYWTTDGSPLVGHINLLEQRANEWFLDTYRPGGSTIFRSGFSYSEGDKSRGELLPRWTTGSGTLDVHPAASSPVSVTLRLADHRPPTLPRASLALLVNGNPATPQVAPVPGQPVSTDYSFSIQPGRSSITIQTDTWNPSKYQADGRNENLGLMLQSITLTHEGHVLANSLAEALPPPAYYPQTRWYYDPGTHYLADLWPVYLLSTGMGRKAMLVLALPVIFASFLVIALAWRSLRRTNID